MQQQKFYKSLNKWNNVLSLYRMVDKNFNKISLLHILAGLFISISEVIKGFLFFMGFLFMLPISFILEIIFLPYFLFKKKILNCMFFYIFKIKAKNTQKFNDKFLLIRKNLYSKYNHGEKK